MIDGAAGPVLPGSPEEAQEDLIAAPNGEADPKADRENDRDKVVQRTRQVYQAAGMASVGLEMAIATLLGWAIGHWLDGRFGTTPWLMLLFLLLGIAAGFKGLIRAAGEAKRSLSESKEQKPEPKP